MLCLLGLVSAAVSSSHQLPLGTGIPGAHSPCSLPSSRPSTGATVISDFCRERTRSSIFASPLHHPVRREPDGARGKSSKLCHKQLPASSDGTVEALCRCCIQEALLTAAPCAMAVLVKYPSPFWHAGPALRFLVALAEKKFGIDPLHKVRRMRIHMQSKKHIWEGRVARPSLRCVCRHS
jgi:hypothetical protein